MSPRPVGPGQLLPLARQLPGSPDPLALHAALTDGGTRPDTLLLETADEVVGPGDEVVRVAARSFLIPRAALRVTCRGRAVEVEALTPGGAALLPWLRERLAGRAELGGAGGALTATFPPAPRGDEETRLHAPSPTDVLRVLAREATLLAEPSPRAHLVAGVFAYDLLASYEHLPGGQADPTGFPDYVCWLAEELIELDPRQGSCRVIAHVIGGPDDTWRPRYHAAAERIEALVAACRDAGPAGDPPPPAPLDPAAVTVDMDDAAFAEQVRLLKERIAAGDVFQIVPSRTFSAPCPDPLATYHRLRTLNPSPYMFYVRGPEHVLLGASPETAVKVTGDPPRVEISPIAGTAPRGRTPDGAPDPDLDGRLEVELRLSEKELAEHMMLIDLARNDVARVSEPGARHVPAITTVDRYSHVMHLVSRVVGRLRADLDPLHAYVASMNMGTLTGAPKLKAAEILRTVEATRRGPYGGAVGYYAGDGSFDSAIVIRSALVSGGQAHVRAGAGVVHDSDPAAEADETRRKAQAVLRALGVGAAAEPGQGARP